MPRVTVPANLITTGGIPCFFGGETTGDSVNGHDFDNDSEIFVGVRNTNGGVARNLTLICPAAIDGVAVANVVVSIGASANRFFGPFPPRIFNQADGRVWVNVDSSDLVLKVFRIPRIDP